MTLESSEKRRSKRVPIILPVNGECIGDASCNHPFKGETRDISYGGLCIKIDRTNGFKAGQGVHFMTRLYQGDFLLKGKGEVCWLNGLSDSGPNVYMGVKVTNMRRYGLWVERIENKIIQIT